MNRYSLPTAAVCATPRLNRMDRVEVALFTTALSWGLFAFGGAYPWAMWPLAIACAASGTIALARGRGRVPMPMVFGLTLVAFTVALQIVPVPSSILATVSPAAHSFLQTHDVAFALGGQGGHAVSIAPQSTWTALALFSAFGLFCIGQADFMSRRGAETVTRIVIILAFAAAIVGVVFKGLSPRLVYGFWAAREGSADPFGPFVNRNHFAGWMVMAAPLAAGYLLGLHQRRDSRPGGWRRMLLAASSQSGSSVVLTAFTLLVVGVSVVFSMSRSGVLCFAMAMGILAVQVMRRAARRGAAVVVAAFLGTVVAIALAWGDVDRALNRFSERDIGRAAVWHDAVNVARAFPWTGTGLNTYGAAMLEYQRASAEVRFTEAHNEYLQIAAEGGVLVGVPVLVLLGIFVTQVRRRFREALDAPRTYWLRVGAVVGVIAIALQSVVEFSLQMPANAVLFAVLCAIAIHKGGNDLHSRRVHARPR